MKSKNDSRRNTFDFIARVLGGYLFLNYARGVLCTRKSNYKQTHDVLGKHTCAYKYAHGMLGTAYLCTSIYIMGSKRITLPIIMKAVCWDRECTYVYAYNVLRPCKFTHPRFPLHTCNCPMTLGRQITGNDRGPRT